ncbi:MAG TPA: class I SAM-dependent methyltransferase [Candidatus Angelobacter sp.]|nr:class I SAM-dependent methyltransferase [Candidatus Angelobacter sp.]
MLGGKPSKERLVRVKQSFRQYLRTPGLVLCISTLLLVVLRLMYDRHAPFFDYGTWHKFWDAWGAAVGVFYTILLGALVVLFPSRLEKKLDDQTDEIEDKLRTLSERIQSPLNDFPEIFAKATELLEDLKNGPRTVFKIISASPVLGLELDDSETKKWRGLLASRIEAGCETEIVCLDPRSLQGQRSPLGTFCKTLAETYLEQQNPTTHDAKHTQAKRMENFKRLYNLGRTQIERFQTRYSGRTNFKLKWSGDPPFQIVIAHDEPGIFKSILYFATTSTLERGLKVSGFYTEDFRMGGLLDSVFQYVSTAAVDAADDPRTQLQRDRDFELQCFFEDKTSDYELKLELPNTKSKLQGFKLFVEQGVFPPEIALAKNAFFDAIIKAVPLVWNGTAEQDRIGIDVGTGTGVLALFLAEYCPLVWATDISDRELNNAKKNFQRYREAFGNAVKFKEIKRDLLEDLGEITKPKVPLFVFNHPYYPSPSNVFNVGGLYAGLGLIERFLVQAKAFVADSGGIVMPYAEIAGPHDPLKVATGLGYKADELNSHSDPKYGEHKVFLFRLKYS